MTGTDGEGSKPVYMLEEVKDLLEKERARLDEILNERVDKLVNTHLEEHLGESMLHGDTSTSPKEKSKLPLEVEVLGNPPVNEGDPNKLSASSFQNAPRSYPLNMYQCLI